MAIGQLRHFVAMFGESDYIHGCLADLTVPQCISDGGVFTQPSGPSIITHYPNIDLRHPGLGEKEFDIWNIHSYIARR